jgi:hypothetical protein
MKISSTLIIIVFGRSIWALRMSMKTLLVSRNKNVLTLLVLLSDYIDFGTCPH